MRQQLIEATYRQVLVAWVTGPLEICGQISLPLSPAMAYWTRGIDVDPDYWSAVENGPCD